MDVKGLLAGRKVMLLKAAEDWTLSVENLLALGRDGKPDTGGGEQGTLVSFLAEDPFCLWSRWSVRNTGSWM